MLRPSLAVFFTVSAFLHASVAIANDGGVYIAPGSEFTYLAVEAPLPARQLGAIALTSLDRLRDVDAAVPSVLGDSSLPSEWPVALPEASARRGRAPFEKSAANGTCKRCGTVLGDGKDRRVAVLYAVRAFQVGSELSSIRVLRLRVRYRDGLVAYINGREVARRNLARPVLATPTPESVETPALAIAERPHGPEWETFYIPVLPGMLHAGNNTLSVEVRPSGNRVVPLLDIELSPSTDVTIIRGPMVQRVGPTTATVVFETDQPTTGLVEYGPTAARHRSVQTASGLASRHVVELRDLDVGKPVHYRVLAGITASEPAIFHTAPARGEVIRFAVYGDVRGGHKVHGKIAQAIVDEAPDMVLVTGDLVLRGSDEGDWQRFFDVTRGLLSRVPFYPAAGNHDTGRSGDERRRMNEIFALWPGPTDRPDWGHWYSFDIGDVHVVMLDSNSYNAARQLTWLEADLQAARQRGTRAMFALTHDGPYSRGIHKGNRYAAKHYEPVLVRHGVTMLFSGHDHLYQRGEINGLRYIVSGGGGAPLYSVRCGVRKRPRCKVKDGMKHVVSEHHYIMVTVYRTYVEVCPKRVDGTPLEPCLGIRLRE